MNSFTHECSKLIREGASWFTRYRGRPLCLLGFPFPQRRGIRFSSWFSPVGWEEEGCVESTQALETLGVENAEFPPPTLLYCTFTLLEMSSGKAGQNGGFASPSKSGDCFHFHLLLDGFFFLSSLRRAAKSGLLPLPSHPGAHPTLLQGMKHPQRRENCPLPALALWLGDCLVGHLALGQPEPPRWGCTRGSRRRGGKRFAARPSRSPQRSQTWRSSGLYVLLTPRRSCECVVATDPILFQPRKRLPVMLKTPAETQAQTLNE